MALERIGSAIGQLAAARLQQAHNLGWPAWVALVFAVLVLLPLLCRVAAVWAGEAPHWNTARWDSAGLAPDPATTPEPVIQFYAARTWGWRGILGTHSWVAFKPRGADRFTRYEVVGWGVGPGVRPSFIVRRATADRLHSSSVAAAMLSDVSGC